MTRGRLLAIAVAAFAAVLVFVAWPRRAESPEDVIRGKVTTMARAAEKHDLGAIMDNISQSFRAQDVGDRDALKGLLAFQVIGGKYLRVMVVGVKVNLTSATTAEMQGKFQFFRSESEKPEELPTSTSAASERIDANWVKEADGEWRVTSATHKQMSPAEMLP